MKTEEEQVNQDNYTNKVNKGSENRDMSKWKEIKLKNIADVKGRVGWKGYTVKDLRGFGALTIGATHINALNKLDLSKAIFLSDEKYYESPEIMVEEGDLLIVQRGSLGKLVLIDRIIGKATINPSMVILKNIRVDKKYLYYYLCSDQGQRQINESASQTGVPMISQEQIQNFKLRLPENIFEQNQISHILCTADGLIEKTQSTIAKYKAIKQGMLHDLFTRGIDIKTGKLRAKYENAPELYKESKLGIVPKDWEVEEFHQSCDLITDGSHFSPKPLEVGDIIANVKDMGEFEINFDSCTRISREDFISLRNQNCSPKYGDVLLSKDGTIGRVILFKDKREIVILSSIAILRPSIKLKSGYLYVFLKSEYFNEQLLVKTSGSALKRIVLRDINNLIIAYPVNNHEQCLISDGIIQIENKLKIEQTYLHKLQMVKSGLMGDLLSGRKRVSEPGFTG